MKEIKNIEDLRHHAIQTLKKLEKKEINTTEAGITAKLYESIISSVKTELEFNRMLEKEPDIPFLEYKKTIDVTKKAKLIEKKS